MSNSRNSQRAHMLPFYFGFCTVWLSFLLMLLYKLTFLEVRISTKSLNERMDLEELMTYGCRPTSLSLVTKWLFLENQQSLPPWLGLPSGRRYPRELTICSYRMAWHCYILLSTFTRPVVSYAYIFSIRRRSRLTVIILGLSKRRIGWDVAAQRSF